MEAPSNATTGLWSTIAGLVSYIKTHDAPPHIWCWPEADWVGQTVPLSLAAYALRHPAGTPETNHKHAIQTEILGFARNAPCTEHADWLGRRVLGPVLRAGVPINPRLVAPSAPPGGNVRMSAAWWASFNGQCGHANVPDNIHTDPGVADYLRIARAAQGEDMTPEEHATLLKVYEQTTEILKALRYDPGTAGTEDQLGARVKRIDEAVAQLGAGGSIDYGKVQEAAEAAVRAVAADAATPP